MREYTAKTCGVSFGAESNCVAWQLILCPSRLLLQKHLFRQDYSLAIQQKCHMHLIKRD